MSYWANASIEFILRGACGVSEIENILGHIKSYEDSLYEYKNFHTFGEGYEEVFPNGRKKSYKFLPEGSEGTLDIYVKKTTKNYTVVSITGGLRDCYTTDKIKQWFDATIANNQLSIIYAKGWAAAECDEKTIEFNYDHRAQTQKEWLNWKIRCLGAWFEDIFDFLKNFKRSK